MNRFEKIAAGSNIPNVVIRYAPKPWDRGEPLKRIVEVPGGYTEEQVESWLFEKHLMKHGEKILEFNFKTSDRISRIASRVIEAVKFDTRKEIQKYKQEHDLTPGTKLQVRTEQEKRERNKDRASSIADKIVEKG